MAASARIFAALVRHELKCHLRSPAWMLALVAAALLAITESEPRGVPGWPTHSQSLDAYQLASTLIFGILAFLLTAVSVSRDLGGERRDLVFSRPLSVPVYLGGKYLGGVLFTLSIALTLMVTVWLHPLLRGAASVYDPRPFLHAFWVAVIPGVLFSSALAVLLTSLARRLVIAFPIYLTYYLVVGLFGAFKLTFTATGKVNFLDFSMRLSPRWIELTAGPTTLRDASFVGILDPVAPGLILRAACYGVLSLLVVWGAILVVKRQRRS